MIEYYVDAASTYAADLDNLFTLIFLIVMAWFVVTEGAFFWLLWAFRAKEGVPAQYLEGHEHHVKRWITTPHALIILCDIVIVVGAVQVWYEIKQVLPEADRTVRIIGQQWTWNFVHPGPDGLLDTEDDIETTDHLHLEVDQTYHYELLSTDVLHGFSIPVFRLKQDAVPGRVITGWFEPILTGEYDLQCAEMCGIGHGIMGARVHIESADEHAAWMSGALATN